MQNDKFRSARSGLPWRLSGKEPTCQCRRPRFDPWSGKIPHGVEQLSLCATTAEPVLQSPGAPTTGPTCLNHWSLSAREPVLRNKRSLRNEKPTHRNEEQPSLAATREKVVQDPAQPKKGQKVKHLCTTYQESTDGHFAMFASDTSFLTGIKLHIHQNVTTNSFPWPFPLSMSAII